MEQPRAAAWDEPDAHAKRLALGAAIVLLGLVVRAAWVTEDAYITLRTVDNLVHGHGLRWNIDERVQGYTHPLWMALLSAFYAFTREDFLTLIGVGLLTTAGALWLLIKSARSGGHAVVALLLLVSSRSFIEYSTSGLENPLTHLLVGWFVWLYVLRASSLFWLALSAALIALNRSDALVVVLPALLHATFVFVRTHGAWPTLRTLSLGVSPYLAWELFSLFYYGFPFPNTAYAKLNTGLPTHEVLRQGVTYLLNVLAWDPPTLLIIGFGAGAALLGKRPRELLLALGSLLYLFYVVRIGGDFMLGRFLTLPLFVAVSLLAVSPLPLERPRSAASMLLPIGLLFLHPSATEKTHVGEYGYSGIADERAYYRDGLSLVMYARTVTLPNHRLVREGLGARAAGERVRVHGNIGMFGYYAGPGLHVIDPIALTDPLLARLPVRYDPHWRVGHYIRVVPEGYVETVDTGVCHMTDRQLCAYQRMLREIVSGDLWSLARLKTVFAMNLGHYEWMLDRDRYRFPELQRDALQSLSTPLGEGASWTAPGTRLLNVDGIELTLPQLSHARFVALSLDGNDDYELVLLRGDRELETIRSRSVELGGMQTRTHRTSKATRESGFDRMRVRPAGGDGMYSVGYVRLLD